MSIEIRNVNKNFGNFTALDNINITVPTGKLTTLLGPSGCGKTTLSRVLNMRTRDKYYLMSWM